MTKLLTMIKFCSSQTMLHGVQGFSYKFPGDLWKHSLMIQNITEFLNKQCYVIKQMEMALIVQYNEMALLPVN
jgi:hypothetical protein